MRGSGCTHRARPLHRHDTRGAGVQAGRRARHRGRHRAVLRGVRADVRRHRCRSGRPPCARGGGRRPQRAPGCARLLHRDVLRAVAVLPARERCAGRRRARRDRARPRRHRALPDPAHQPDRGRRSRRFHRRRADGLREAVGAAFVPAAHAASPGAAPRHRDRACGPTRSTSSPTLEPCDLAYLDPPYNQHRYFTNYHVWETLVAWDAPEHYGVACKRIDARDDTTKSRVQSAPCDARRAAAGDRRGAGSRGRRLLQRRVVGRRSTSYANGARRTGTSRCSASIRAATWARRSGSTTRRGSEWARCRTCATRSTW